MIIVIRGDADESAVAAVVALAERDGLTHHLSRGAERSVLIVGGGDSEAVEAAFRVLPQVETVLPLNRPYRLAGREVHPADTLIEAGGLLIGADAPAIIAGPPSPTASGAVAAALGALRETGVGAVRVGVYRPSAALYGTPQLDPDALRGLDALRRGSGLATAVEVLDAADVPAVARHADLLVVGGAQMHSRPLLEACGWSNRPLILERAESARIEEWLQAADQVIACGNRQVVLCEAGIRTFEPTLPATLDLSSVPYIRRVSHLPVIVSPARGVVERGAAPALALAAIAAGAHGLLLDVHLGGAADRLGALSLPELTALTREVADLARALATKTQQQPANA